MTDKDDTTSTEAIREVQTEENVLSIFKNLKVEKLKDKPKVSITPFDEVARKNQELQDKLVEERKKKNKNVLRSYRIK